MLQAARREWEVIVRRYHIVAIIRPGDKIVAAEPFSNFVIHYTDGLKFYQLSATGLKTVKPIIRLSGPRTLLP